MHLSLRGRDRGCTRNPDERELLTADARAGRTSQSGVSESSCARRGVGALAGCATVSFAHSSLELVALRVGQDIWVAGRVPRYTPFTVSQSGKRPHAAAR
jgi:hypothetical protein